MASPYSSFPCYGRQPPSLSVVDDFRTELQRMANALADHGMGKVEAVRIEVGFGDGSAIAFTVNRDVT